MFPSNKFGLTSIAGIKPIRPLPQRGFNVSPHLPVGVVGVVGVVKVVGVVGVVGVKGVLGVVRVVSVVSEPKH